MSPILTIEDVRDAAKQIRGMVVHTPCTHSKVLSKVASDYLPGDVVSWRLNGVSLPHIGVVTRKKLGSAPLVAHNIGLGTQEQPCLFDWPMSGWFRFESWT